jgi:hypothetical protein
VVGECFERGAVGEGRVQPSAVVEDLDVVGDGEAGAGPGGPAVPVVHLVLQGGEEGLRGGVVPAHPGAADTRTDVLVLAEAGEFARGVLGAAIRTKANSP